MTAAPNEYMRYMSQYADGDANAQMKRALTDMAFQLATAVWNDAPVKTKKGELLFCIGGINSINPFSASAIKNEILVYSSIFPPAQVNIKPLQGAVYNASGKPCELELWKYAEIYLGFTGPASYWNESWQESLGSVGHKIKGVFVMGGVYANQQPVTSPSIPNKLNRFSSATMNQLYHPQRTADFFSFVSVRNIPTFLVPNNAVDNLAQLAGSATLDSKNEVMKRFLDVNKIGGPFLRQVALAHYSSVYEPPYKAYDLYAAKALAAWLDGDEAVRSGMKSRQCSLYYSNAYGLALVSAGGSWEEAREQYAGLAEGALQSGHGLPAAGAPGARECMLKELEILRSLEHMRRVHVHDLRFELDPRTLGLRLRAEAAAASPGSKEGARPAA
jgi:hypothetical protein